MLILNINVPLDGTLSEVELPCLYSHIHDSTVKPKLGEAAYCLLTLDLCMSTADNTYLNANLDFVDTEWYLNTFFWKPHHCLMTILFQTLKIILSLKFEILQNLDLPSKNAKITTKSDSGSNFTAAFADGDRFFPVRCFNHSLDLTINKGLKLTHVKTAAIKF